MDTLTKIVNKSATLTKDEKRELVRILDFLDPQSRVEIRKLLEEEPSWIRVLSKNLTNKRQALQSQDMESWNKIVEEELVLLSSTETTSFSQTQTAKPQLSLE